MTGRGRRRGLRQTDRITARLEQCGEKVVRTGPAGWTLELQNGKAIPMRARLAGHWLTLATTPELEPADEPSWRLLELNGSLPAGCRFILDANGQPELRADLHLGEVATDETWVPDACNALQDSCASLGWHGVSPVRPSVPGSDLGPCTGEPWAQSLAEAGWALKELQGHVIGLDFEARGSPHQVRIARTPVGVCFTVEITRPGPLGPVAREALATMLLTATAALRVVRASAGQDERGDAARFEVLLRADPSDALAELAVGGLVLATQRSGQEARALVHAALASQYLATISQGRARCGSNREQALTYSK